MLSIPQLNFMVIIVKQELLDWVDEFDVVIKPRSRNEIHKQQLRHRSAHMLIFNSKGQVLLQKRSLEKEDFPGCWDVSVSGHVCAGETYHQCIIRETMEEVGIEVNSTLKAVNKFAAKEQNGWEFVQVYTMQYDGPIYLNSQEIIAGKWIYPAALLQQFLAAPELYTGGFNEILTAALEDNISNESTI